MNLKFLLLLLFVAINNVVFSQLKFNEYSCSNFGAVPNPAGTGVEATPDWVEIINTTGLPVKLSGYSLSDNRQQLAKWPISDYNSVGIYLDSFNVQVIFLDLLDKIAPTQNGLNPSSGYDMHTNFQLNQTQSPWLYITKLGGQKPIDSVAIQRNQPDHSWGKPNAPYGSVYSNGGRNTWYLYPTSSAGKKNPINSPPAPPNWFYGYAPTPKLSLKPGYYTSGSVSGLTVLDTTNISTKYPTTSLEIFVTTDCTVPTSTNSPNILSGSGSVPVSLNSGAAMVRSIIIDQSIPPLFLPSFEAYGAYVVDSVYHMGVTCICLDTNSLFITKSKDTVLAVYSYIDKTTKKEGFKNQGQALIKKLDFLNTTGAANLQWQFQFRSEDEYGYNYTNKYGFYQDATLGGTSRADFPELVFRSGSEDNFLKGGVGSNGYGANHIHDFFNHTITLHHKLNFESSHYTPTYLFVNGTNRGIYYIKEPIDTSYTQYYYNYTHADIIANDLVPTTTTPTLTALAGNITDWSNFYTWIMSNGTNVHQPAIYQRITDSMDIASFCDYNFYNMFSVNTDFVKRQALWWKGIADTSNHSALKWRFGLSNTDLTWGFGANHTGIADNSPTSAPCDYINAAVGAQYPLMPIFKKLMNNDTFKTAFLSRYQDLLNTSYSCDSLTNHLMYVSSLLKADIGSQVNWFVNGANCTGCDSVKFWNAMVDSMKSFIMQRCSLAIQGLKLGNCSSSLDGPFNLCLDVSPANAGYIKFNSLTLKTFPWNAKYLDSLAYSAKAIADSNYVFDHWQSSYTISPGQNSDSVNFYVNKDAVPCMTAIFKIKPAYETNGTPMLPTAFSPNNDGNNDILNVYGIQNASSYEFEVYNRWGQQLFYSTDKTQGWDGTYNNEPSAVGVYAYRYNIVINGKVYIKNGSFTLLR
jgi:gliding motility-associated-like protein